MISTLVSICRFTHGIQSNVTYRTTLFHTTVDLGKHSKITVLFVLDFSTCDNRFESMEWRFTLISDYYIKQAFDIYTSNDFGIYEFLVELQSLRYVFAILLVIFVVRAL